MKGKYFEEKYVEIDELVLSAMNPRYTTVPKRLESNLIDWIQKNDNNKSQNQIIEELLKNEGDLRDLYSLIKNICLEGFDNKEEIYVVTKNHSYVIAEGNRRIWVLNLLLKKLKLPSFEKICDENIQLNPNQDENNLEDDDENNWQKKIKKNYDRINKYIENFYKKHPKWDKKIRILITNNSSYLWSKIYEKHINGTSYGLRRWPRGKYFVDLLENETLKDALNDSENLNKQTIIHKTFRKPYKTIKSEYKEALFIYELIKISNTRNKERIIHFIKTHAISALQTNYCFNLIKKTLKDLGYGVNYFKKNILDYEYDKKCNITFIEKSDIKSKDLFKFIIKWFDKKIITSKTKNEKKAEEYKIFEKELIGLLKLDNDFKKINFFETGEKLTNIVEEIKQNIFKNTLLANNLDLLIKQYNHNNKLNGKYVHALVCTIRTILEIIIICCFAINKGERFENLKSEIFKWNDNDNLLKTSEEIFNANSMIKMLFLIQNEKWNNGSTIARLTSTKDGNWRIYKDIMTVITNDKKNAIEFFEFWMNNKNELNATIHRVFITKKINNILDQLIYYLKIILENLNIAFIQELEGLSSHIKMIIMGKTQKDLNKFLT